MQEPMTKTQQAKARLLMHSATFCGRASLLAFVLFIFTGPFFLVDMNLFQGGWLVWDTLLSSLFFVQHSGMIRRGLQARMAPYFPAYFHAAIFTVASGLVIAMVVVFWQPSGTWLIELQGPWRWLTKGVFFLAAAGMGWGVWALKAFDPYGKGAIQAQLTGKPLRPQPFTIQGPYLWVRHPLYFFVLVMLWSCPDLTADRLLFNLLWSGWIYVGTVFEEKDLVSDFGPVYQRYQKQVPMLLPWKGPGKINR
jgi:methanethiol S-methyltransferase